MKDNLSFCIVTKNNEETLPSCIESFFDICKNISYIDMGSTDKTVGILEKYNGKKFKKDIIIFLYHILSELSVYQKHALSQIYHVLTDT